MQKSAISSVFLCVGVLQRFDANPWECEGAQKGKEGVDDKVVVGEFHDVVQDGTLHEIEHETVVAYEI